MSNRKEIKEANNLVMFYSGILPWYNFKDNLNKAKQCAIKAVDLLIKDNAQNEELVNGGLNKKYWEDVKKEIEFV